MGGSEEQIRIREFFDLLHTHKLERWEYQNGDVLSK